jgi:hypothetical protein
VKRWASHLTYVRKMIKEYCLVGQPEVMGLFRIYKHRKQDNIRVDFTIELGG